MGGDWKKTMIIVTCGIIGILFAIMIQMMDTNGIIVNELLSGSITLKAVQTFIIILWTGMGVLIASATR